MDPMEEFLFFFQRGGKEMRQNVRDLTLAQRLEKKIWLNSHSAYSIALRRATYVY
jgi:hypothetical protein